MRNLDRLEVGLSSGRSMLEMAAVGGCGRDVGGGAFGGVSRRRFKGGGLNDIDLEDEARK